MIRLLSHPSSRQPVNQSTCHDTELHATSSAQGVCHGKSIPTWKWVVSDGWTSSAGNLGAVKLVEMLSLHAKQAIT